VQNFVAYATKVRHGRGREWMGRNRVAVGNVCWMVTREPNNPKESTVAAPLLQKHILFVPG
jgi:hypothetical protein